MKKSLISLLIALTIGVGMLGFSACGGGQDSTPDSSTIESENSSVEESSEASSEEKHEHDWKQLITKQADCEQVGEALYSCSCGEEYTEEISALGHENAVYEGKAPTCAEFGWEAYEKCQREGCTYTTYTELAIDPNNHNYVEGFCEYCGVRAPSKGLVYALSDDGTYYIVSGIGACKDTEIVIRSIHNGLPVTSIGSSAFKGCSNLTEIVIPDGVTSIGSSAFNNCSNLTEIVIPDGVTSIGSSAFYSCENLTEIVIPDGVTSIGDSAFYKCSSLTEIVIPGSVTSIGSSAFSNCNGLMKAVILDGVESVGDYAFSSCGSLTEVVISDSVTWVGYYAFYKCDCLTNVIIGKGVTSISNYAFALCYSLTEIVIPDGVTSIGGNAFYACDLKEIVIPDGVTSIGTNAFLGCDYLTEIVIPDSVTSIGENAFSDTGYYNDESNWENSVLYIGKYLIKAKGGYSVNPVKDVYTIKDGILCISGYAFFECRSLTGIIIPDSVTSIGENAFNKCSSLTEIVIPDSVTSIGQYAFKSTGYYNDESNWENGALYIGNYLIEVQDDIVGGYTIKDGTLCIGDYAFWNCSKLTEVIIPDSLTSIGFRAFVGCTKLKSITFNGTVEQWNAIEKGEDWRYTVAEIFCSDGTVTL